MKQKIVVFTGSQGSGKTTMMNEVYGFIEKNHAVMKGYYQVESISREAQEFGFQINEETTFETQYYLALQYMVADIRTRKHAEKNNIEWIILDRSVLDVIPFTRARSIISDDEKKMISSILLDHYEKYPVDYLFYCEPLNGIVDDGIRSTNQKFQKVIDHYFHELLDIEVPDNYIKLRKKPILERLEAIQTIIV